MRFFFFFFHLAVSYILNPVFGGSVALGRGDFAPPFCNFVTERTIITKLDTNNTVYLLTNIFISKYDMTSYISQGPHNL